MAAAGASRVKIIFRLARLAYAAGGLAEKKRRGLYDEGEGALAFVGGEGRARASNPSPSPSIRAGGLLLAEIVQDKADGLAPDFGQDGFQIGLAGGEAAA